MLMSTQNFIPKRGSFDPNLKRGTFDQNKYVRSCDVTVGTKKILLIQPNLLLSVYIQEKNKFLFRLDNSLETYNIQKLWNPRYIDKSMNRIIKKLILQSELFPSKFQLFRPNWSQINNHVQNTSNKVWKGITTWESSVGTLEGKAIRKHRFVLNCRNCKKKIVDLPCDEFKDLYVCMFYIFIYIWIK